MGFSARLRCSVVDWTSAFGPGHGHGGGKAVDVGGGGSTVHD